MGGKGSKKKPTQEPWTVESVVEKRNFDPAEPDQTRDFLQRWYLFYIEQEDSAIYQKYEKLGGLDAIIRTLQTKGDGVWHGIVQKLFDQYGPPPADDWQPQQPVPAQAAAPAPAAEQPTQETMTAEECGALLRRMYRWYGRPGGTMAAQTLKEKLAGVDKTVETVMAKGSTTEAALTQRIETMYGRGPPADWDPDAQEQGPEAAEAAEAAEAGAGAPMVDFQFGRRDAASEDSEGGGTQPPSPPVRRATDGRRKSTAAGLHEPTETPDALLRPGSAWRSAQGILQIDADGSVRRRGSETATAMLRQADGTVTLKGSRVARIEGHTIYWDDGDSWSPVAPPGAQAPLRQPTEPATPNTTARPQQQQQQQPHGRSGSHAGADWSLENLRTLQGEFAHAAASDAAASQFQPQPQQQQQQQQPDADTAAGAAQRLEHAVRVSELQKQVAEARLEAERYRREVEMHRAVAAGRHAEPQQQQQQQQQGECSAASSPAARQSARVTFTGPPGELRDEIGALSAQVAEQVEMHKQLVGMQREQQAFLADYLSRMHGGSPPPPAHPAVPPLAVHAAAPRERWHHSSSGQAQSPGRPLVTPANPGDSCAPRSECASPPRWPSASAPACCPPVAAWLHAHGLGRFEAIFAEHEIDAESLALLTERDLCRMGVGPLGPRKALAAAVAGLRQGAPPLPDSPASRTSGGDYGDDGGGSAVFVDLGSASPAAPGSEWTVHLDPASRQLYYHDPLTGRSSWHPPAPPGPPGASPPPTLSPLPHDLRQLADLL